MVIYNLYLFYIKEVSNMKQSMLKNLMKSVVNSNKYCPMITHEPKQPKSLK